MNKLLLPLFIGILYCSGIVAQNREKTIEELEWIVDRMRNCIQFHSEHQRVIKDFKTERNQTITEIDFNADFLKFCAEYDKIVIDLDRKNVEKYPNDVPRNHIIFSTGQKNNTTEINVYYETVSKRPQVPSISRPQVVNDVSSRPQVDSETRELLSQLEKIRNSRTLHQDLSQTLLNQINYNLVETVDNAGDLFLKHVSVPQGDILKTKAMEEVRKYAAVENEKPIKNEIADFVNSVIDGSEKIIELIPGGDKITNHLLWKFLKSTPEAGRGLGHIPAALHIYFNKREHDNKVQELNFAEQQVIKAIENRTMRR